MKKISIILFLIFSPSFLAGCAEREEVPSSIVWLEYEEGLQEGKDKGMPILVDFYADWCPPCKKMDEETYTNSRVIKMAQQFVMVKVNVDNEPTLSSLYIIEYIPTAVFLDSNGHEIHRKVGYTDASQLIEEMEKIIAMIQ